MLKAEQLTNMFLTEGTEGMPSTHKAQLAERTIGVPVQAVGVRGPEPTHIVDALELVYLKWLLFHQNLVTDAMNPAGEAIEMVADVACSFGSTGRGSVEAKKEKGIVGASERERKDNLVSRVAARFAQFGTENVMAEMDAALVVAHTNYESRGQVVGAGVATTTIALPGNPLRDSGLLREYLEWSCLGETTHTTKIPWGIDLPTVVGFLGLNDWWGKQGYVYREEDLVSLPWQHTETLTRAPKYTQGALEYFHAQGRVTDEIIGVVSPELLVGMLGTAFNFPVPFVQEVVASVDAEQIRPGRTVYMNPIFHS